MSEVGPPVLVVGAGLAGLKCASELESHGIKAEILEASDGIGGRARTDQVDGFSLDRGFQVLLKDYPEAIRTFDYEALNLGSFVPGAMIRVNGSFSRFGDPLRMPRSAIGSAASPAGTIADKWRLFRMKRDLLETDPQEIIRRPEMTSIESLQQRGFTTEMIEYFFRPFFGGVFIDPDLTTSSRLMEIFMRCFSSGDAAIPASGMGELARQLADRIDPASIRLGTPVASIEEKAVVLGDGSRIEASAVVVATDERSASELCGLPEPTGRRVTKCIYFDAPETKIAGSWLVLSPIQDGPINELAIPSSVATGYAPDGRSLVAVSVIGSETDRVDLHEAVVNELGEWFGQETVAEWNHLRTYTIEAALPAFDPGRHQPEGNPLQLGSGIYLCGDHRETPSIQGALVSGRKAADAVTSALGAGLAAAGGTT
ncbi:MAG: NAD(P)/FAD-dependent oxidoreductase [Solirubrobacterales bacterium]